VSEIYPPKERDIQRGDRVLGGSMVFVAVRCTIQYIILPFALPLFGLSDAISVAFSTVLEAFALGMIAYNLIRLWNTSWRWRYLALSIVMAGLIGAFLYMDIRYWLGP
jgi:hypothetical protein